MQTYHSLPILLTVGLFAINPVAATATESSQALDVIKIATVTKMYQQDIDHEGMDNPVVLEQYANADLQAAMQLEQDYFDKTQMSCNVDYDVLWNSQDPDYTQDKKFSMADKGLVQVSLAQGSNIYYDLTCNDKECQIADVSLNEDGETLSKHLLEACR
ncbi:hypothetical protein [Psychrobacter sp. JB385]|uniref:hypothetical protein n=1 Tax=Psychrobacter sp. JB385 TaxID=1434841 RepID=UPI00097F675E|nr:hypothetical protein [Psychrobacter sp. JB385]SJN27166.1 hypothetical protein Psyc124501 [Psychrobacter sp. JB385]